MTRTAYLDLIGGAAGDMLLGALIDAGADDKAVFGQLENLGLEHRRPHVETVLRRGIRALHVAGTPATGQGPRTLDDITDIIHGGLLPAGIADQAIRIFARLIEIEAKVHGQHVETVRLHEAGDDDAIFDVVGFLLAVDNLNLERIVCSAVPIGGGRTVAGVSWPGPAALEMLKGVPITGPPPSAEATTPTGAAIVTSVAESFGSTPAMTLEQVGYGAGSRDVRDVPNVVRVLLGQLAGADGTREGQWLVQQGHLVIEANIDDLSPQLLADAVDALFEAGALDVWQTPIQMKRGRMAATLSALVHGPDAYRVKRTFFQSTTTLGVREYPVERSVLRREVRAIKVRGHKVRMKYGWLGDALATVMPEHADLINLGTTLGLPVRQLWHEAMAELPPQSRNTETSTAVTDD